MTEEGQITASGTAVEEHDYRDIGVRAAPATDTDVGS